MVEMHYRENITYWTSRHCFFLAFEAVSKLQERVPIKLKMSKCQSDKINSNKTKLVNERVKNALVSILIIKCIQL